SSSKNTSQEGGNRSHSENESYTGRDLMTAGEVKAMPDDTQLIVFANKPPMKTKKALQFELFPEPEKLLYQTDYERNTNPEQVKKQKNKKNVNVKKAYKQVKS